MFFKCDFPKYPNTYPQNHWMQPDKYGRGWYANAQFVHNASGRASLFPEDAHLARPQGDDKKYACFVPEAAYVELFAICKDSTKK